jgi:RimJ/RimL family protein N-acetyltransferase
MNAKIDQLPGQDIMNRILIDLPEAIETPRLRLQMPKAGFGGKLHQAMMDGYEDYAKWLSWSPDRPTVEAVEEECRKHHADFILREYIRYIILDKTSDAVIGRCAFPPHQTLWAIPQFGISYFIRENQRGNGYAAEATHAMALLAFRVLKAMKVEVYCDAENTPSTKIPLKLNFKLECTKKGGWPRQDGALALLQTYSVFSEDELPKMNVSW